MAFIISTVAQGVYTGIISLISTNTMAACSVVKQLYTYKNPEVDKLLNDIDLEAKMNIYKATIYQLMVNTSPELSDLQRTQLIAACNTNIDTTDPVKLCLKYLCNNINNIHSSLHSINNKVKYHQTKYFHKWRVLDIDNEIKRIKKEIKIMDNRFNTMINLLKIK